jgi:cytochrome c oxidase subunit 2
MRRRAVLQMIAIGVLFGLASGAVAYFIPWLPDAASSQADAIDEVYWFVAIICGLIFALVAGVSIYAGWRFRAPPDDEEDGAPIHGHTGLEITWTAIPAALVTAMSVFSGLALADIENLPDDHRTIKVTAQQFAWSFEYEDLDRTTGELVLKEDEPVQLVLTAKDVIHAFWVPEFRMKQDAVPGVETNTYVTPTKPGTYDIICTELCGLGHAIMRARARVLPADEYERWAAGDEAGGGAGGGAADGKSIFDEVEPACSSCHTLADAGADQEIGPNLDNVLKGKDEDDVRESILDPDAKISEGFQPGVMPKDYGEKLSDEQLDALVKYLLEATN